MNDLIKIVEHHKFSSIYIVGDLHGCFSLLMQELNKINFNFDNDLLICTGDLIDRGAENLECIGLLEQPWFCTVRGNHEEMCIRGQHDPKMKDMHARNGGAWFYQQFQKTPQPWQGHRDFLHQMTLIVSI